MSLRTKVILSLFIVFTAYAAVEYIVQRRFLMPAFVELERAAAVRNAERAVEALQREAEMLIPSAADWATWDDTYRFVLDGNAEYRNANLNLKALESLKVNLLAIYNTQGRRIWGMAYDHDAGKEIALGELSADSIGPAHPLLGAGTEDTVAGLLNTDAGLFIVASRPVLTSGGEGPVRGRVVVGRLLDEAAIARLGLQARVNLKVEALAQGKTAGSASIVKRGAIGYLSVAIDEKNAVTEARTTLLDVAGTPILRLRVDTPRTIVSQGRTTLNHAAVSQAIAGAVVLLVLLILLRRTVFDPVSRLTRHAIAVGAEGDLSVRLAMDRTDEIGTLAQEFDRMVGRLAETRQRLLDQSYRSGVAEMASGALHNIGNAITPLGVKLIALKQELAQAPAAEMAIAADELSDPATPADRRADLAQFVELAGTELAAVVRRASGELDAIRGQMDHVQMILADQQRFSRAERVLEPIAPLRFVDEAVQLLPENLRQFVRVEVDPGLEDAGRVRAARVALQQVVGNLLINAAESVRDSGRKEDSGRIRIHAACPDADSEAFVHLCFEDNGTGISAEHLPHLFARGFSTKNRGSGMGLHWSANTVSAMGGRLYAESAGIGQGACFHLLLPLADAAAQPMAEAA
ncbi:CHASE4 domain-containing protein [Desulfococcus sp.]|uniref:CHASE4 domain-containing protein n=1 Tax=Desulfococcus sp. TaxID=2025834 RepID=UPI0035941DCD